MIIFPAIDIKDGKVVRLSQGKFDHLKEYSSDPVEMAQHWQAQGALWLHVVDLDGALKGKSENQAIIKKIAQTATIPVQTGGGIRSRDTVADYLDAGVNRVVLGTKVIEDRKFLDEMVKAYKDKIAVSLDCSDGYIAQRGWTVTSNVKATSIVKDLEALGVRCLIHTDIARDGMLTGPNIDELKTLLKATSIPVIASGGVSGIEDIKKLKNLEGEGLIGAITGKAIYEGKLDLKEALAYAD